jgi:hypothetical protein
MHDLIFPAFVPASAHRAIRQAPATWQAWLEFWQAADDPDFEVLAEDIAGAVALFRRLEALGVEFDWQFREQMEAANLAIVNTDADADEDAADQWTEDGEGHRPAASPASENDPRCWAGVQIEVYVIRKGRRVRVTSHVRGDGVPLCES